MDDTTARARMWADLFSDEMQARRAQHDVTKRAELYLYAGLPLERVLDALRISRATWYRRLEALREFEAENRRAADQGTQLVSREDEPPIVEDPEDGDRVQPATSAPQSQSGVAVRSWRVDGHRRLAEQYLRQGVNLGPDK